MMGDQSHVPVIPNQNRMSETAEIVVNGKLVGHGLTGMYNALEEIMNETETTQPNQPGTEPQPTMPAPGPTDPPTDPPVDPDEPEVPGEEEVPDSELMNPDEADNDDTVDNTESETYPEQQVPETPDSPAPPYETPNIPGPDPDDPSAPPQDPHNPETPAPSDGEE